MGNIDFDFSKSLTDFSNFREKSLNGLKKLLNRTEEAKDCTGWLDLPTSFNEEKIEKILETAKKVNDNSEILIVIGIGGSYLGTRAIITSLSGYFNKKDFEVVFAGNNLSGTYLNELIHYLKDKEYSLNVVSKSGSTMEPAIAFRILKNELEKKYGKEEAKNRVYITTDENSGCLRDLVNSFEFNQVFTVPKDVGGRYSVLSEVGLFPLACYGIDIRELLEGAKSGKEEYLSLDFEKNAALKYAAIRNALYESGKKSEIFINFEPKLYYFSKWLEQLYGESEGKDGRGILPISLNYTTDLHSLGQIIQDGEKNLMETFLTVENPEKDMCIPLDEKNMDKLNYLADKGLNYVNEKAIKGVSIAHSKEGIPVINIKMDRLNEYFLGKLIYFFEVSCAVSGFILGVNPFNQPGVEKYKKQILELLAEK